MKSRVYVDTSVVGGCFDDEFVVESRQFFRECEEGKFVVVVSDLTMRELELAPVNVQGVIRELGDACKESVRASAESERLARLYIDAGVVTKKHIVDAEHIAIATVHRVDVLVSWNFQQIVRLPRIRKYNSVNLSEGYPLLEIRSPKEVLGLGEE